MKNPEDLPEIEWPAGMSDPQKNEWQEILYAYDRALRDFESDYTVIFPSESDRRRTFFASLKRWKKKWSTPGPCMHPGCGATSISRSHSIPMSASIREIAEDGHVVTPKFRDNGVDVVPVGIREASTFPGFCEIHEAQFAGFESQKKMTTIEHFRLQAYRTLCREIYTQRHHKQKFEEGLDRYRKRRDAFISDRVRRAQRRPKPIDVKSIRFDSDRIENRVVETIESISENISELVSLYDNVLDELKDGVDRISMTAAAIDLKLPVCLSGFGSILHIENGVAMYATCFLAVIPEATASKIIVGVAKKHEKALTAYFQDQSSTALIERLESWMCHGSDHWFMTPSAWGIIPQARRDAICERILDETHSIVDPVEFSILDGVRNRILEFAAAQLGDGKIATGDVDEVIKLVAEQKAKLSWIVRNGKAT